MAQKVRVMDAGMLQVELALCFNKSLARGQQRLWVRRPWTKQTAEI
jgi:hypothetical protein